MKTKVILLQVVYFSLLLCLKFIFYTRCDTSVERFIYVQSDIEVTLEILFLLGLSFGMCRYILKSKKMFCTSLWMGFSLFLLFEVSNLIEYLLGFLPNYNDVPQIIRLPLVLVVILVYMCTLYLICLYLRKRKGKVSPQLGVGC